tara:strand:- start:1474 stop:1692 length:219 start_codon:yes stop_codon:yes gene_type:complete
MREQGQMQQVLMQYPWWLLVEQRYLLPIILFISSHHQAVLDLILQLLEMVMLKFLSSLAVAEVAVVEVVQVV